MPCGSLHSESLGSIARRRLLKEDKTSLSKRHPPEYMSKEDAIPFAQSFDTQS